MSWGWFVFFKKSRGVITCAGSKVCPGLASLRAELDVTAAFHLT